MKTRRRDYSTGSSPQQAAGAAASGRRQRRIGSRPCPTDCLTPTQRPCFGEMSNKRAADDLTRFSNDNKRICVEEGTDSLISGIFTELFDEDKSNLCKSVVSIVLFDEHKTLSAFSGIAIEWQCNSKMIVTTSSLASALRDVDNDHDNVKIQVLDDDGNIALGILGDCDSDYGIAVVRVMANVDVYCIPLNLEVELMPYGTKVVAVGRDTTGVLLSTSGTLTATHGTVNSGYHVLSTCKLHEVMQGGALFDSYGNFVGMNLFSDVERSIFLPRSIILERLGHFHTFKAKKVFLELVRPIRPTGVKLYSYPEESFGDAYPKGVWRKLKKGLRSDIFKNVVALASFNGDSKVFACTGFFIDFDDKCPTILTSASLFRNREDKNKFCESLRIEVLLPQNELCEGKLLKHSLHYNVALVSVKGYNVDHPVNLKHSMVQYDSKVVAVVRCFESGALMAASGEYTLWSGKICESLRYTTCKITEAGIGGPLVDFNGKYVGMNFYDAKMGTPYLFYDVLCGILEYFKNGETKYMRNCHLEGKIVEDSGEGLSTSLWRLERSPMREEEVKWLRAALAEPYTYGYKHGRFYVYQ
ncbi:hypothetical protein U9M48_004974 [Paspalum notatum var. saurae]|uniref:Uncharacterized protein n=1 Tax=Paspalum notatum var. saurae TaxID=547442 RepID=A0AAQ3PKV1_PASNO